MQLSVRELSADEYPLWDQLVAMSPQGSIFAQRWWMDTVTDGQARLLGCFLDGQLAGGTPIWPCRKFGVPRLCQPALTPYWGPLLAPCAGDSEANSDTALQILRALARACADWADVTLQMHPLLQHWIAYYWEHFAQNTCYTYRIDDWSGVPFAEQNCCRVICTALREARETGLTLREMIAPEQVLAMYRLTVAPDEGPSCAEIQRIWPSLTRLARDTDCLYTIAAVDAEERLHAALAIVWDARCSYVVLSGSNPSVEQAGGWPLLLWHALSHVRRQAPAFDYPGTLTVEIEAFLQRFGCKYTPYSRITRSASWVLNGAGWLCDHMRR